MTMEYVGKRFVFDYGGFAVQVHYLSDSTLAWEQLEGPQVGLKAEESYQFEIIRPDIYFIWWQEHDSSIVTQVVDFEKRRVSTTWISPEKNVEHFQGTLRE